MKFKGKDQKSNNYSFLYMKKFFIVVALLLVFIILLVLCSLGYYKVSLEPVDKNYKETITIEVEKGDTYYSLASKLKDKDLIKSELTYKVYLKLNKPSGIKAGTYKLSKSNSVSDIIHILSNDGIYTNPDEITIKFLEGKHMRYIAKVIEDNTNNKASDVSKLLKDKDYLNSLINDYWFIDKSILNKDIYYSLEGYLYPNTYNFTNKDVTVKEIFKKMLDEMEKKLEPLKQDILNSKYSAHEILTLASIVEVEGGSSTDRAGIAGVFFNRLNSNWSLGSDVTTYYAAKVELNERDLYQKEIEDKNAYNTRSDYLAGKLPVGPICNPSIDSISAVLHPKKSSYYYFVADKNGKTYFTKTYQEHLAKRDELKRTGLWYDYN